MFSNATDVHVLALDAFVLDAANKNHIILLQLVISHACLLTIMFKPHWEFGFVHVLNARQDIHKHDKIMPQLCLSKKKCKQCKSNLFPEHDRKFKSIVTLPAISIIQVLNYWSYKFQASLQTNKRFWFKNNLIIGMDAPRQRKNMIECFINECNNA